MIYALKFLPYRIPFHTPIRVGTTTLDHREGLVAMLYDTDNRLVGMGDIAPLPGLSKTSFESVVAYCQSLTTLDFDSQSSSFSALSYNVGTNNLSPCIQFGLDSACLWLLDRPHFKTSIQALCYQITPHQPITMTRPIKVKLGRHDMETELSIIQAWCKAYPNAVFRFDVNQRWSLEDSCSFFSQIPLSSIAYVEDPCSKVSDYEAFYQATSISYAIDTDSIQSEFSANGLAALIIKPTLLGNTQTISELANHKVDLIFSSCFESPIGLHAIAWMADYFTPQQAHGLDTLRYFHGFTDQSNDGLSSQSLETLYQCIHPHLIP